MGKMTPVLIGLLIMLCSPALVLSDCTDLGSYTNWTAVGEKKIMFYHRNTPLAQVELQDCPVNPSSNVRLLKTYVCDGDKILVDSQECNIISVSSASAGSL